MTNFKQDFQEAEDLINGMYSSNIENDSLIKEIKEHCVRNVLATFSIPSEAYFQHVEKWQDNWSAEYDKQAKSMFHSHQNYNEMRDDINRNGAVDYSSGVMTSGNQLHVDHITSANSIHENIIYKMVYTPEERSEIANEKENLAPLYSSANQSKSDKDLKEWSETISSTREVDNATHFGADKDRINQASNDAHIRELKNEAKALGGEFGSLAGNVALSTVRVAIGYCIYQVSMVLIDEIKDLMNKGHKGIKKICSEMYKRADSIGSKIKSKISLDYLKHILKESFKSSAISGIVTLLTGIVSAVVKSIFKLKVVAIIIKQSLMFLWNAGKTIFDKNKDKLKRIGKLALSSVGAVATVFIADTIFGFLPDFPFKDEIGYTISGIFIGIISIMMMYSASNIVKNIKNMFGNAELAKQLEEQYTQVMEIYERVYKKILKETYEYYDRLDNLIGDTFNPNATYSERFDSSISLAIHAGVNENKILKSKKEGDNFFNS